MSKSRVGIIGLGVIGQVHLKALLGLKEEFEIVGVTDAVEPARTACAAQHQLKAFAGPADLVRDGKPDYVVICTPHYSHTEIASEAMRLGAHVLIEKPMAIRASKARECLEVARATGKRVGVGFMARLEPLHGRMKALMQEGFVGDVIRMTMMRTAWFRSMAYYRSGSWRGTWSGEGGGILANQAPHDLDFILWLMGMPSEVLAEIDTAWHEIEVEDVASALLKWPNGAVGTLQVNTAEAPGRAFLEIVGTRGTLLLDETGLKATRLSVDSRRFSETTKEKMTPPPVAEATLQYLPYHKDEAAFQLVHQNFAAALRSGVPLVCPGEEGLAEVELADALLVSGIRRQWTRLPVEPRLFNDILARLTATKSVARTREELAKR